MLILKAAI